MIESIKNHKAAKKTDRHEILFTSVCFRHYHLLLSSLPPSSFMRFYHKWCISKSFLGHFHALAIKLSNLNLRIIFDEFTFIIACLYRKISEVVCSSAYLVPLIRLTFLYQIRILDNTEVIICHNFPLS